MNITYTGTKEKKHNGNWRCYFLVKNNGNEKIVDYQIRYQTSPIPQQMIDDAIVDIEARIVIREEEENLLTSEKYRLRTLAEDIKECKDIITHPALKTNAVNFFNAIKQYIGDI